MNWFKDWDKERQEIERVQHDQFNNAAAQQAALANQSINSIMRLRGTTAQNYLSYNPSPYRDAEEFLDSLIDVNPDFIREIVVLDVIYYQILGYLGYATTDSNYEKVQKQLNYNGIFLLKNEKYQFDLDKYIEDGPAQEIEE